MDKQQQYGRRKWKSRVRLYIGGKLSQDTIAIFERARAGRAIIGQQGLTYSASPRSPRPYFPASGTLPRSQMFEGHVEVVKRGAV